MVGIECVHGCAVVELFSWAGPCNSVVSTQVELKQEHDDESKLQFLKVRVKWRCKRLAEAPAQVTGQQRLPVTCADGSFYALKSCD